MNTRDDLFREVRGILVVLTPDGARICLRDLLLTYPTLGEEAIRREAEGIGYDRNTCGFLGIQYNNPSTPMLRLAAAYFLVYQGKQDMLEAERLIQESKTYGHAK